ncbi:hypothetical protein ABFS83_13G061600 [Erythranthe nasuta]
MGSLPSLVNFGSVNMTSFGNFESSVCLVSRVSCRGNGIRFRSSLWGGTQWRYFSVCRYSLTTTTEQGVSVSLDSNTYRGSKQNPVLKSVPKVDPLLDINWDESEVSGNSGGGDERSKVIESLEKVEKLESSSKVNVAVTEPTTNDVAAGETNQKPLKSAENSTRKSKTMKSVWRRGDSVAVVQKVVKQPGTGGEVVSESIAPSRKVQPKLHTKPSVDPPPSVKKPVVLKNAGDGNDLVDKTKTRKPILIDKFASKKPLVDPLIAQAVLPPRKPGSRLPTRKVKDDWRKKSKAGAASDGDPKRRRKVSDDVILDEDVSEFNVSIPGSSKARTGGRKWTKASRKAARRQAARDAAPVRAEMVEIDEDGMLTEDLAYELAISEGTLFGFFFEKGIRPDGVQKLSKEMVKMICKEYGVEVIDSVPIRVEEMAKKKEILDEDDLDKLEDRPPVLTIMGHVDHGKTTLLDYIRKSKVAAGEAGGITQGIGAYKVQVPIDGNTQTCVFLDTPGHEAFGAMRARGARVTDIAVIVIAADDGIRPQTSEAIAHAKAAGVPIIVAINKIDKDGANPDRVIQDLSAAGLMPEEWGGDIPMVKISALKGASVDELLETIMLVAELQELKANPKRNAKGTVIEAGLDKSKGPMATFIVQNGTLKKGDVVVCGEAFGKVRAIFDDNGKRVDEAGPSIPVQVIGLNNVPLAGDEFEVVVSLDIAREKAEAKAEYLRNERITAKAGDGKVTLSSYASAVSSGKNAGLDLHQLNIILKVDVQGSIEAIRQAMQGLPQDNITIKYIYQATGDLSNSDIDLAIASEAIIFGFNVRVSGSVKSYANNKSVEIRLYKIIYELIDDVRKSMEGLLDTVEEEVPIGMAEVRAVFSSGSARVAGCMVTEGKVVKDCGIRVLRNTKEVYVGVLNSLKRVKEMVNEVNAGLECGIGIEGFNDWEAGDIIEVFNWVEKRRSLEEASATMSAAVKKAGY